MKIIKKISFATEEEVGGGGGETLQLSYRSTPGLSVNTGTLCSTEITDFAFYMYSSTQPIVTTGDVAYNTNNLTSPFNGANKFYKVVFAISTEEFIVQIDASGVMTVQEACPI